ncbi:hypothetical protein Val02_85560 [Virgisporangium aliadipatigenens]|uniref:LamG-like jellyroll fold domain-containing protein n=1 Tax=Virgisporangium aliadipatigenens TaxID=741659 RepID=A0A8J4DUU9_9ACTN|nr:LamG-like jellyroll fold domain-containing protein [Virgisporangium aliadipatigenens]GIJ51670.1 hypothetical protein Val02_85560 [Virgisporangium aliadipatigenens]
MDEGIQAIGGDGITARFVRDATGTPATVSLYVDCDGGEDSNDKFRTQWDVASVAVTLSGTTVTATPPAVQTAYGGGRYTAALPVGTTVGGIAGRVVLHGFVTTEDTQSEDPPPPETRPWTKDQAFQVVVESDTVGPAITAEAEPVTSTEARQTVRFTATDSNGVRSASWELPGRVAVPVPVQADGRFEADVDWRASTGAGRGVVCPAEFVIRVRARDHAAPVGNEGVLDVALRDRVAPTVVIRSISDGDEFPNDGDGASVPLAGTAEDYWSGVTEIQYALDRNPWMSLPWDGMAVPVREFFASVRIKDFGRHRLEVRARDAAGVWLAPPAAVEFEVATPVETSTAYDPLSATAYLADLLGFAGRSVKVPRNQRAELSAAAERRLVAVEIGRLFHRSPTTLVSTPGAGVVEISPVRAVVETFRTVLDPVRRDLVAHWRFTEGGGPQAADGTGNGFTARAVPGAAPTWVPGPTGSTALRLDGERDELAVSEAGALTMSSAVSIAAWLRPENAAGAAPAVILAKEFEYGIGRTPDGFLAVILANTSPGWQWLTTGVRLDPDRWTHACVVYDRGTLLAYAHGRLVFRHAGGGELGSTSPKVQDVRIGGGQASSIRYRGALGDLRVYRGALEPAAVRMLAEPGVGPLAFWPMTHATGEESPDEVTGRPLLRGTAEWAAEPDGRALSLAPGRQARIEDVAGLVIGTGDFTVNAWIRLGQPADATTPRRTVLRRSDGAGPPTPELTLVQGRDALRFTVATTTGELVGPEPVPLVPGRWTHVAAMRSGSLLIIYVDGRRVGEREATGRVRFNSGPITIGDGDAGPAFTGLLTGLEIHDRALAAAEVASRAARVDRASAAYLRTVYRILLDLNGVSFDELRLIRSVADRPVRERLAGRLGLRLRAGRPDELDDLLCQGPVTEGWLETTFGLPDTAREPGTQAPPIRLVQWRRATLRALWQEQDAAPARLREPLLDPALVTAGELPGQDDLRRVLSERSAELRAYADDAHAERRAQPDRAVAFAALVDGAGIGTARLAELAARRAAGEPIADDLAGLDLQYGEFARLLVIRDLAAAALTDDEDWSDLVDVLVAVRRRRRLAGWKAAELTMIGGRPLILAPETFALRERPPDDFADRSLRSRRSDMEDRLATRVGQDQAIAAANTATCRDAEAAPLSVLRDALLPAVAATLGLPGTANAVSEALLADIGATAGAPVVSRAMSGVELVGGLLFALRTRQLNDLHPAARWSIPEPAAFDADWLWMSSFEAWRAAMLAFFYPESMLYPAFRPGGNRPASRSAAFEAAMAQLRRRDGTPATRVEWAIQKFTMMRAKGADPIPNDYAPSPASAGQHRELNNALDPQQAIPAVVQEVLYFVPLLVAVQYWRWGLYPYALDWFRLVYDDTAAVGERVVYAGLRRERNDAPALSRPDDWLRSLDPHTLATFRAGGNPYTRFTLMALAQCLLDLADSEFTKSTTDAVARARSLYLSADGLLADPDLQQPPAAPNRLLAENPLLVLLRLRSTNQLLKLRQGRNIAGMMRPSDEEQAAGTQPVFDANGTPVPPARPKLPPTGYRYAVLIDRVRRLVALAAQVENAYLGALERQDMETYRAVDAGRHIALAEQGVQLQRLRLTEAGDAQELARRRQRRSQIQQETYQDWIDGGPSSYENTVLAAYIGGGLSRIAAIGLGAAAAIAAQSVSIATASAGSMGAAGAAAAVPMGVYTGTTIAGAFANAVAAEADTVAQVAALQAGWERREDEWRLEKNLADQDFLIGDQERRLSDNAYAIAEQELATAALQNEHQKAIAEYLATKFLNAELYEWMSGVLGDVYATLLQQATTMALLAQQQLGFERQAQPPVFIKDDYWVAPIEDGSSGAAPDRRGLTGSARLLQDVERLDEYAFLNNRRKLNLSHTLSLASLVPFEFQRFRTTGELPFNTPMRLFDRVFPGHYLRLIRQVRVSLVALVPPQQGIRATLTASGVSRVVVKGESFATVTVRRDPEQVALTGLIAASGVFELDTQAEMLLPFESMGIDTAWVFQLPRPANPIDYDMVADVLVTIDYTALSDPDLRRQVIEEIGDVASADRAYSLRSDFPDGWFALHDTAPGARPVVEFTTLRSDFPRCLDDLRLAHVVLYLVPGTEEPNEADVFDLRLTPERGAAAGGPARTTPDGVISTRRANGTAWLGLQGTAPVGDWRIEFEPALAGRLADGSVTDILLVLSFAGRTPPWPAW